MEYRNANGHKRYGHLLACYKIRYAVWHPATLNDDGTFTLAISHSSDETVSVTDVNFKVA